MYCLAAMKVAPLNLPLNKFLKFLDWPEQRGLSRLIHGLRTSKIEWRRNGQVHRIKHVRTANGPNEPRDPESHVAIMTYRTCRLLSNTVTRMRNAHVRFECPYVVN